MVDHPHHDHLDESSNNAHSSVTFPFRLYQMLEEADKRGFGDIVSWLPDGNGFIVHDREQFTSQVMKTFFCHTKWKSFLRQLNLYNFERLSKRGPGQGSCYFHPCLIRGEIDQCKQIHRSTTTTAGTSAIKTTTPPHHQQHQHDPRGGLVDQSVINKARIYRYFREQNNMTQAATIHDRLPLSSEVMDLKDHHDGATNIVALSNHETITATRIMPFFSDHRRGGGVDGYDTMTLSTSHLDHRGEPPGCHNHDVMISYYGSAMLCDDSQHDDDDPAAAGTSTTTPFPEIRWQFQERAHQDDHHSSAPQRKNESRSSSSPPPQPRLLEVPPPSSARRRRNSNNSIATTGGFATNDDDFMPESSSLSGATIEQPSLFSLVSSSCSPNPIGGTSNYHIATTTASATTNQQLDGQGLLRPESKNAFSEDMADAIVSIFCRQPS